MKFNFFDIFEFEIDWRAVAFISIAPVLYNLVDKVL